MCSALHIRYSVPYQRATDDVEIRLSASTVEVFYKGKRCASHVRSFEYGGVWSGAGWTSTDAEVDGGPRRQMTSAFLIYFFCHK